MKNTLLIQTRVDDALYDWIEACAKQACVTRAEWLRQLLIEARAMRQPASVAFPADMVTSS